jgi:hypothetical protein
VTIEQYLWIHRRLKGLVRITPTTMGAIRAGPQPGSGIELTHARLIPASSRVGASRP